MKDARAGFWKAICAEPDEDAHRLVFADWLEENGEAERAEFIRTQIELARLPFGDVRRVELEVRERVLLQEHRAAWLEGLAKWIDRGHVTFRRGFPWSVHTSRKEFLRNASALATRTVIQEACLDPVAVAEGEGIAGLPVAGRLRSIRTWSSSFADLHDLLTACPGLTALALFHTCDDGDVGDRLADLLALPSVRGLTQFTLRLRDEGEVARRALEAVADTEFTDLRTLGLEVRCRSHEPHAALLRAPFIRGLTTLSLYPHHFDARVLETLGGAAELGSVKSLRLFLGEGGGTAFARLAESAALPALVELSIAGPESECATALDSGVTGRLRALEVRSWNRTGEKRVPVVPQLVGAGRLAGLVRLRVEDDQFTEADASALAASSLLPALVHLDLGSTKLATDGLETLARSPHLPALRAVTTPAHLLGHTRLDDALRALNAQFAGRFVVLAPRPGWTSLRLGTY